MGKKISRRQVLRGSLATLLVGTASILYSSGADLNWLEVVPVRVALSDLAPAFHGYRIAQFSDIHIGTAVQREHLLKIVAIVNQQKPDLVAITGDFVTLRPERFSDDLITALKQLTAPDGVICVMGNHDYWTDSTVVRRILRQSDIIELSNDVYTLERGDAVLNIAGADDVWEGQERLDLILKRLPSVGPAIMLAHEPDFADRCAATERFGLQMSGHSHGGQIVLPIIGPPIVPPYAWKYPLGRYQVGKMVQYTNRGVGTTRMQVRVNCRPELTIFTLETV